MRHAMSIRAFAMSLCVCIAGAAAAAPAETGTAGATSEPVRQGLKAPSEFLSIADPAARSRALFEEIGKLLTHPRCMNCHPAGAQPLQGADSHVHMPPVWRAEEARGTVGTQCAGCHHEANFTLREEATYQSIPGHPRWELAPLSMAWEGKSIGDICRQLKDQ